MDKGLYNWINAVALGCVLISLGLLSSGEHRDNMWTECTEGTDMRLFSLLFDFVLHLRDVSMIFNTIGIYCPWVGTRVSHGAMTGGWGGVRSMQNITR